VVNGLRDYGIVSVYVWPCGGTCKGENLLGSVLDPGSGILLDIAPGRYNLLAFDEPGNPYGVQDSMDGGGSDTLALDLEHLMYDRPNVDLGGFLLEVENRLQGLAIDRITIFREDGTGRLTADGIRVFPGWGIYLWLDRGTYSLEITDQVGRVCRIDSVTVPGDAGPIRVEEDMLPGIGEPLGIVGDGSIVLLVENHLPYDRIEYVGILPDDGSAGEQVEDAGMEPGRSMAFALDPGGYTVLATDGAGASYRTALRLEDAQVYRLFVQYGYLEYDFGFRGGN
jgi:hypothetical protein